MGKHGSHENPQEPLPMTLIHRKRKVIVTIPGSFKSQEYGERKSLGVNYKPDYADSRCLTIG